MGATDIFVSEESAGVRTVTVAPVVLMSVLDHYIRRSSGKSRVIGTLLGRFLPDGGVQVTNTFPVQHKETAESVELDIDRHKAMYQLHRRVSATEELVGWYATGTATDLNSVVIHEFYGRECARPVHVLVDAGLSGDGFNFKAFVSTAYQIEETALDSEFRPIPAVIKPTKAEKVGLDVLFRNRKNEESGMRAGSESGSNAATASEIDNLEKSMSRLLDLLTVVGAKVDAVVAGEVEGDVNAGRFLAETLTMVPKMNASDFEKLFGDNMRDLLMVAYLCKLTQAQLVLSEKLLAVDTKQALN